MTYDKMLLVKLGEDRNVATVKNIKNDKIWVDLCKNDVKNEVKYEVKNEDKDMCKNAVNKNENDAEHVGENADSIEEGSKRSAVRLAKVRIIVN